MSGNLMAKILQNVKYILNYSSNYIPTMIYMLTSLAFGVGLSFFYDWITTLIILGFFPLMIFSMYLQFYFMEEYTNESNKTDSKSYQLVLESLIYIKSLKALSCEEYILKKYS